MVPIINIYLYFPDIYIYQVLCRGRMGVLSGFIVEVVILAKQQVRHSFGFLLINCKEAIHLKKLGAFQIDCICGCWVTKFVNIDQR